MSHHKGGYIKNFRVKHLRAAGTKTEQGASFCHQHFRKMQRKQPTTLKTKRIYKETPETTNPCQVVS